MSDPVRAPGRPARGGLVGAGQRCGRCGSPIFTLHPAKPDYAWVKAGIIHDPKVVKPAYENWVKDKVEWASVDVSESHEANRKV